MTIEKKADGRMRDDDPTVLEALRAFNCGMFDVPDATNPRGYVTKFWPEKAMAKAISTLQRPTREEVSGEEVERVARALARCDNINTNNDATYAASSYGIRARAAIEAMHPRHTEPLGEEVSGEPTQTDIEMARTYLPAVYEIIEEEISKRKWHLGSLLTSTIAQAIYDARMRAAMNPKHAEPTSGAVDCVGCEGSPAPENNPCAVCGRTSTAAKVAEPVLDVDELANVMLDAWKRADPLSDVARYPASYIATFADVARAVLAKYPPAVDVDKMREAIAALLKGGSMMIETAPTPSFPGARKLSIGFGNADDAYDAMEALSLSLRAARAALPEEPSA